MAIPILSIKNLSKDYSAGGIWAGRMIRALDHVSLDIAPGEMLGLVGESGCGKTTLARCALRLTPPTSGSVYFDGVDLNLLSSDALRRKRREFQIIFQDPFAALDPNMRIRQILLEPFQAHGLGTRGDREKWIRELAEAVSLDPLLLSRRPANLSGGQQQRVGIARALSLKPRLLVADEPVSALDVSVQAQILNLLAELQRRFGLTLILISHSLPVVHYLCSRVAVMYLGRIVEEAPASEFFAKPKHPYSELLLQSMPSLTLSGARLPSPGKGELPKATAPPPGCAFHPRCPHARAQCRKDVPTLSACGLDSRVACFLYTSDHSSS
ncbi:MAG TPA: ABC transporter ATP-binding protein [Acidobacteriota bacterium]|nr:ABC transporter ATP-binding protein [Acidobacteriota bacterium]